jgi:hypothetical protein
VFLLGWLRAPEGLFGPEHAISPFSFAKGKAEIFLIQEVLMLFELCLQQSSLETRL